MADVVYSARCADYQRESVAAAVDRLWAQVFPDGDPFQPGQTVLLKPNLLMPTRPERAVTTHPLLVEVVARKLKGRGLDVAIGDSPGAGIFKLEQLWEITGMTAAAQAAGARLVALETAGSTMYPVKNPQVREILITDAIKQYDHIVNLPKLKTHALTLLTGAVKNLFGLVPGAYKAEVHRQSPKSRDMMLAVCALREVVTPTLTVMDAVVGMEGNGPNNGTPAALGHLLAGRLPEAVDVAMARLVGVAPARLAYLTHLYADAGAAVTVGGDGLPSPLPPFALPGTYRLDRLPAPLLKLASRLVTLQPDFTARCRACGVCVKACPAHALRLDGQRVVIERKKCFSCFCCQELCPHQAIDFRRSLLGRVFFRDFRGQHG